MSVKKIQKGDKVKVISGNHRGMVGIVTKVVNKTKNRLTQTRVSISTIPKISKYFKANKAYSMPGMMNSVDRMVHVSNVMHIDDSEKVSKIKIEVDKNGKKARIYKTTSKKIEKNEIPKEEVNELNEKK